MVSKAMLSSLLQKQLSHTPAAQPFHAFVDDEWRPFQPGAVVTTSTTLSPPPSPLHSLHLVTWNIDFMAPYPQARMSAALSHLAGLVSSVPTTSAVVVFLQEMAEWEGLASSSAREGSGDVALLQGAGWVQERFYMSDVDGGAWGGAGYGTVTLIDRRLSVARVGRLPFVSEFRRDALFIDVHLSSGSAGGGNVLRLCNVHLDSMSGAMRPVQWRGLAQLLRCQAGLEPPWGGVAASILAGDCNANRPRDRTEPQDNGFRDAYLELGGIEGDEAGATWGFQSASGARWGRQRLDKMVFCGDLEIAKLDKVGVDVRVEDAETVRLLEDEVTREVSSDPDGTPY
ncbi:hypothetical protein K504DRAFT_106641 [Pleomassaria siparia CBS 279.74]|uniref:Endonuclease/exonuclease/phosphatase domain-containing protein n=1 Tax=Pleomassaria siparia CBS 279.74 TaxID=1314801 RepID=A0A6G1JWV1_9PLEO|nr:hypothetical protein K504DRAFT_106641 [Pleomassaria siparia CBS 279.74]